MMSFVFFYRDGAGYWAIRFCEIHCARIPLFIPTKFPQQIVDFFGSAYKLCGLLCFERKKSFCSSKNVKFLKFAFPSSKKFTGSRYFISKVYWIDIHRKKFNLWTNLQLRFDIKAKKQQKIRKFCRNLVNFCVKMIVDWVWQPRKLIESDRKMNWQHCL